MPKFLGRTSYQELTQNFIVRSNQQIPNKTKMKEFEGNANFPAD